MTTHRTHLPDLNVDLLVTTYDDGTVTAAVRPDPWSTWGVPVELSPTPADQPKVAAS